MNYPNQLGQSSRHVEKSVRVATHVPALSACVDAFSENVTVIEHGMGISSTPWFHAQPKIFCIISYEDVERWKTCACDDRNKHIINSWTNKEQFKIEVASHILDLTKSIALIDGPGEQRDDAMLAALELDVAAVIVHDIETYDKNVVNSLCDVASSLGYRCYQHIALNPETLLCFKHDVPIDETFLREACVMLR